MGPAAIQFLKLLGTHGGKIGQAAQGLVKFNAYFSGTKALAGEAIDMFKKLGDKWVEMQDIAFQTGRSMAMSREMAMRYDRQLMQSTKELARQYGINAKEIADFQKTYAETVGRNIMLNQEQTASMAAMAKLAGEHAGTIIDEFDKVGVGIQRATAYTGRLQERAKALGISPAKATKMMADNIKLAASYSFRNGVNDIEKMAFKATSMRMDMNAIMNATEKFADIEGAISTSANIQMLGGTFAREFSNPMGAMFEAQADPEAFQKRILRTIEGKGRYDAKTGAVTFDPVTMRMMRELAKNLGMSVEQITNPAMAQVQNQKVDEELKSTGAWNRFSDIEREAIRNLSRTNINEETGEHQVTYTDVNGELVTRAIKDLTSEELQIAQDRQMSEDGLFKDVQDIKDILERTLGRARGTTSTKENLKGFGAEVDAFLAQFQNGIMTTFSGIFNGKNLTPWDAAKSLSNKSGRIDVGSHADEGISWSDFLPWNWGNSGQYAFAEGGIVKPLHASVGTIVPGDSYIGDHTPVMANAGEMIINPMQQKSMFNLISSLAMTGGMAYGANKIGNKMGIQGVGSTMLLANVLGGGKTDLTSIIEAHFIKKALKGLIPLKTNIAEIGSVANETVKSTSVFKANWKELTNTLSKDWKAITDNVSESFNKFARRVSVTSRRYFTTGRLGKVTSGIKQISSATGRYATKAGNFGIRYAKLASDFAVGYAKQFGEAINNHAIKPISAFGKRIYNSKPVFGVRSKLDIARYNTSRWISNSAKPKAKEYSKLVRNLFNDGSKAQTSKIASRYGKLGTPEIAMTGRSTGVKQVAETTTKEVSKVAKAAGNGGKLMSGLSKVGKSLAPAAKFISKKLPVIGNVLAVGGALSDMSSASSQYDAKIDEIERSGMSDLDKAKAKDRATKEKNASYGSSIGSAAGTAIGGALGSALGPLGTVAGMWLGEKAGSFLGKGIGGLFGGSEEKKFKEEQKEKFSKYEDSVKSNDNVVKILTSIDNKLSVISGKSIALRGKELASPTLSPIDMMKKTARTAKTVIKSPFVTSVKEQAKKVASVGFGTISSVLPPVAAAKLLSKGDKEVSIKEQFKSSVKPHPILGNFMKVAPSKDSDAVSKTVSSIGKTNINLNISGTIKLEGGGKSVDFDLSKLIETPEFKRKLTEIIQQEANVKVNAGKVRNEYDTGREKRA